jgi:hypothetical protein
MPEQVQGGAVTVEQTDGTIVNQAPVLIPVVDTTDSRYATSPGPGTSEMIRRGIVLVFGLIQIFIGARIVLLVLDARESNGLVSAVLNISQFFVAPFDGILRTDALHAAGSTLDITAIVALVGWTILELIAIWVVAMFRRDPA